MKQSVPRVRVTSWKEPQDSVEKGTQPSNPLDTSMTSALVSPSAYGGVPPRRGTREILRAYQTMPWLRATVNKIGTSVGATSWKLFVPKDQNTGRAQRNKKIQRANFDLRQQLFQKERQKGDLEEFDDHPLLDLLHTGNPKLLGQTVFQLTQQHIDLVGEAFWILERNLFGTPISVWPLPPDWIDEFPTNENPWFRIQIGAVKYTIPVTEVIPFIDPDPSNPYGRGIGIAKALGDELETDEYIAQHLKGFFYNRARPDIIVSADNLSRSDTRRLEERWLEEHRGFWNAFKPHFINRKVDVQELGQSFENMQLIELRKHERDTVLQVFGIPPEKLGILSACHDEETECLTKEGFKHYTELSYQDEIATLHPTTGEVEYHNPREIYTYDYSGEMHWWHGQRFDVKVTPNHRMFARYSNFGGESLTDGYQLLSSEDLAQTHHRAGQRNFLAVTNGYEGTVETVEIPYAPQTHHNEKSPEPEGEYGWSIRAENFASFLGYWITEGSVRNDGSGHYVRISQNPGAASERVYEAFKKLGLGAVPYTPESCEYVLLHKSLKEWLINKVGQYCHEKVIPQECFEWPMQAKKDLLIALVDGDGHWGDTEDIYNLQDWQEVAFSTTSQKLADDLQRLAVECGLRTKLGHRQNYDHKRQKYQKDQWVVRLTANVQEYPFSPNLHRHFERVHYEGQVWCVNVPNGIFITRRNGKIGIHGNSNRSTISASDFFWTKDVIMPRIELIRNTLQDRLVPLFDDRLVLDFESPVVQDKEHQLNVMSAKPGAFTINEWRREAEKESIGDIGEAFIRQEQDVQIPVEDSNKVPRPAAGGPAPEQEDEEPGNQQEDLDGLYEKLVPAIKQQIKKRRKQKQRASKNAGT